MNQNQLYDIVIIGGGPAGANLARLIGKKYKVALIDRRNLGNEPNGSTHRKCCGGLLAPDAQKMLARLGLALEESVLVNPQIMAVDTFDFRNDLRRLYQRFYYNMDREVFDRWLISLVPSCVDRYFNSVFLSYQPLKEGYEISYKKDGSKHLLRARVIVGGDGAYSKIRRSLKEKHPITHVYAAIQEWYPLPENMPYHGGIFDESITDFYSWFIPKGNALIVGAALRQDKDIEKKFQQLKDKLQEKGIVLGKRLHREGALINRPSSYRQVFCGQKDIYLIGEAAGAISPSSAEGISYALHTSLLLAESMEDGLENVLGLYQKKMKKIQTNILGKHLKSPAMYQPWLRGLVMKSGLESICQTFMTKEDR